MLGQLSQSEQSKVLADPQVLNGYSYARGNPLANKDTNGLWALKVGVGGTIPGWGLTGGVGLAIDSRGIDYYANTGLAVGGQVSSLQITTADLQHQYSVTNSVFATGGGGVGVEVSKGMTYFPYSERESESTQQASFGLRGGLGGGAVSEVSGPVWVWGRQPRSTSSALPQSQMQSGVNAKNTSVNMTNYSQNARGASGSSFSQTLNSLSNALKQLSSLLSSRSKDR